MSENKSKRKSVVEICHDLALPIAEKLNLKLWDIKFVKEGAMWYLRVFIDRDDDIVSIDDCADVSRELDVALDKSDPIDEAYCLEVCSPGVERELSRDEHFDLYKNEAVVVKLIHAAGAEREIAGILSGYDKNQIVLLDEDENEVVVDRKNVSKIHVLVDWDEILG